MSLFAGWRRPETSGSAASDLYHAVVAQARDPAFYRRGLAEDTIDGRFDMLVLHVSLALLRLCRGTGNTEIADGLFEQMTGHFDVGLRQAGAGDLSVGKRVKRMVQAFYGRLAAYDAALASGGREALEEALRRNLYRGEAVRPDAVTAMASYIERQVAELARQEDEDLRAGRIVFAPAPGADSRDG